MFACFGLYRVLSRDKWQARQALQVGERGKMGKWRNGEDDGTVPLIERSIVQ